MVILCMQTQKKQHQKSDHEGESRMQRQRVRETVRGLKDAIQFIGYRRALGNPNFIRLSYVGPSMAKRQRC